MRGSFKKKQGHYVQGITGTTVTLFANIHELTQRSYHMSLSAAHEAFKTHFMTIERTEGEKFFPASGQVMYTPSLQNHLIKNPQETVNKIGFSLQGKDPETVDNYTGEMQCLLTYPEARTDDGYLSSLEHADDFLAAVNNTTIDGKYFITLKSGPTPMPEKGFLEVRIDFRVTSITID